MRRAPSISRPLAAALLLSVLALPAQAAVIVVNSTLDNGDGANCTLREAVESANTDAPVGGCAAGAGADTIRLGGLAIALTAGEIPVTSDVVFDGAGASITAALGARIFPITGAVTVSIDATTLADGVEANGGAVLIDGADVTVNGSFFDGNFATVSGGAIFIGASGSLTLNGVTFVQNRARGPAPTDGGGGVYSKGAPITADFCEFTDNRALGAAGSGGGISNPFGGTLLVSNSFFSANRAQRAGGGIETVDGVTRITDTEFLDNTAGPNPGNGGAVHGGGAVALSVTKTGAGPGGDVTGNSAQNEGGGLWIGGGGTLTVTGVTLDGNQAAGTAPDAGGGAIYSDGGALVLTALTVTNNRATGTSGSGGGILTKGAIDLDASSTVSGNRAKRAGGGIEITNPDPTTPLLARLTNVAMGSNAVGSNPGNGGALHTTDGPIDLRMTSVTVFDNTARNEGGGLWVNAGTDLLAQSVSLRGNRALGAAATNGGAGLYSNGADVRYLDGSVVDNQANGASGSGGGFFANGGTLRIERTQISQNTARRAGGGLEAVGATVDVLDGTSLSGNRVGNNPGNGGGIHVGSGAVTVDNATLTDNEARNEGGGLWNSATGTLTVTQTTVAGNLASFGGGLFMQGDPALTGTSHVLESTFDNNRARQQGGGLYASAGAEGRIGNSTFWGNRARFGGGGWTDLADVDFESVTLARNIANVGGGLFNTDPNTRPVQLANTLLADNTAGSDPDLRGRYASADHNLVTTAVPAAVLPPMPNDQVGVAPGIGALAANGGPTMTVALLAGSPAVDAGSSLFATDQRGAARADGADDVGAYEFGASVSTEADYLVIAGVVDGPLPGGLPKAIEVHVVDDVADLARFGLGAANNGGGSDGVEFAFPSGPAVAGDVIHVATEATEFGNFFGFAPTYTSSVAAINGDDAIELFYDPAGVVVGPTPPASTVVTDTFGDPNVDGTGEPWEYLDGWAYRVDGTGPDGSTFVPANWTFSGVDALDGETTNGTAATPFPIGSYVPLWVEDGPRAGLEAQPLEGPVALSVVPNPVSGRARATVAVAEAQRLDVRVVDVMGREVARLFEGPVEAQTPVTVGLDGAALASGVYVVVVRGETVRATRTVTVVR